VDMVTTCFSERKIISVLAAEKVMLDSPAPGRLAAGTQPKPSRYRMSMNFGLPSEVATFVLRRIVTYWQDQLHWLVRFITRTLQRKVSRRRFRGFS